MSYLDDYGMTFTVKSDKESPSFNTEKIVLKAVRLINTSFGDGAFIHFIGNDGNEYACLIVCCTQDSKFGKES
jgi:hypothetical protein